MINLNQYEDVEAVSRSWESHMETLRLWKEGGCEPGSCTRCILEGDLYGAARRADIPTRLILGELAIWIVGNMPWQSFGSVEKVRQWQTAKRREQHAKRRELMEKEASGK